MSGKNNNSESVSDDELLIKSGNRIYEGDEEYRVLFENSPSGIIIAMEDKLQIFNPAAVVIAGRSKEELSSKPFTDFIHPDDAGMVLDRYIRRMKGEPVIDNYPFRIITGQGKIRWIGIKSTLIIWKGKNATLNFINDITERKEADNALKQSEEHFRFLSENMPAMVCSFLPDSTLTYVNDLYCRYFTKTSEELVGYKFLDFIPENEVQTVKNFYMSLTPENPSSVYEHHVEVNGDLRWHEWIDRAIFDDEGNILKFQSVGVDITERKMAEREIKKLLEEKELILQEVHHRIKNNMNTMNAVLSLHADTLKEPSAVTALKDAGSRIRSMMMLYDKLYQSEDFNQLSCANYLSSLVDDIIKNFPNSHSVTVKKNILDFRMSVRVLQPLGIILNELLTNSMKHAFIGRDDGVITVSVTSADNSVAVIVQDNGCSISESVTIENSASFGMQLVRLLTRQLGGRIRIERGEGTKFILEFEAV